MGSKFWHDLLDVALYFKRSKRKIDNFDIKNIDDIKNIERYLDEDEDELAKKALETHKNRLIKAYGEDATFAVGYEHIDNQHRVVVQVFDRILSEKMEPYDEQSSSFFVRTVKSIKNEINHYSGQLKRISYTTDYGYVFQFPVVVH